VAGSRRAEGQACCAISSAVWQSGAPSGFGTLHEAAAPVYHAAMLDPHTAAELPLDEVAALVDELLDAHGERVPPLRRAA
jgi:hypothetical protein